MGNCRNPVLYTKPLDVTVVTSMSKRGDLQPGKCGWTFEYSATEREKEGQGGGMRERSIYAVMSRCARELNCSFERCNSRGFTGAYGELDILRAR